VFGELGRAPEVGDEVHTDGIRLSVLEIEGSRIMKLEVEFGADDAPTDEPAAA
jgi:CBS domain containing-hemolysin-like protein